MRFCNHSKVLARGQALIEVLLALSIAATVITAVTATVVIALDNAQFSRNHNLATAYAQEGMEIIRLLASRKWSDLFNPPTCTGNECCLPEGSQQLVQKQGLDCEGEGDISGGFIRAVDKKNNDSKCSAGSPPPERTLITVSVRWRDGRCPTSGNDRYCHEAKLVTCLIEPDVVPTP